MRYLAMRLFGLAILLASAGITYYNWQRALTEGMYSRNMAIFGPVGVIGGLFREEEGRLSSIALCLDIPNDAPWATFLATLVRMCNEACAATHRPRIIAASQ